ncbi:unnamed protein product [Rhizoctonia solani]|uniref:HAT C-terminal dimerisation domain-containing protein n=1 Tax=Rhizoctonia solani TaxID=456999 RepID=A0A8H3AZU4_9AGAM|nr:unnamed protein product [Rhizoctonia solani]
MIFYLRPALEGHFVKANAIRTRVINHGTALRQKTQAYLNNLSGLLAIACDAWTSSNKIAFLAITASWITELWTLKETLLDFVELKGAHDGKNLADAVATAVTELGISDKILALVSDNASNNGTLIHHLTSNLRVSSPNSRWDGSGGHIRCLAHIIHLAVMALLRGIKAVPASTNTREFKHNDHALTVEEAELIVADDNLEASETDDQGLADPSVDLQSGIEKIRKISRIVRSSPQRMELFRTVAERIEEDNQRHAKANNMPYEKKSVKNLILDIITRWNSTYLMLERALESSEAIDALTSHSKIKIYRPYALSPNDWAMIGMACKWLKFFRSALTRISGEKYPTLSYSLYIYFVLITYVSELEKEPFVKENLGVLNAVQACMSKLQEFLDKSVKDSQYYYYAMVLDPQYKSTLFSLNTASLQRLLPHTWLSESAESFAHTCGKFYDSAAHPTVQPHLGTKYMDKFEYAMNASMPQSTHQHQEPTSLAHEIQEFLAEPTTTMEPLEWWSKHQSRFPRLAAMARDYLCIPELYHLETATMSELTYINYEGAGQANSDACHYSQAVIIGDIVRASGQGGWDDAGNLKANDAKGQVDLAFDNVDKALRAVGLRGWEDVFSVRSYHRDIDVTFQIMVEKLKQRIPGHRPTWTSVQVVRLAFPEMEIEIEVEAYRGKK